ncbi:MAG: flagellar basal-body MS-ring/collar protein FliF [Bacillota bacterium]|nr:flagellar basal-body MS-ring/collar protein FliF [Bacillota bacterium]
MDEEKGTNRGGLMENWQQSSRSRQVFIVITAAVVIAVLLLFVQYFTKPQYVTLYSNLDPAQAAPLVQHLRERGVPYRIEDFGATIKVSQSMADEMRIEMAGRGMPFAQGLGFELFDEDRLGMTDFERQVKMQRALQEELRRTITSIDAVTQARVHLVLPEPRVFLRERGEPSAAIYLQLNPFLSLKEEQVRGIVFLVASSVENLKPENITLIDSQGNILYDAVTTSDPHIALADSVLNQLSVKRSFEVELERRAQNMLERVFGPGKALALVTVDMDFDSRETTVITYDEAGVPRSTYLMEERHEGEGPVAGEVGEANYPGYVGVVQGGESSHDRREETVNYEIGESTERMITAPGKVLRVNTSVVIDTGENSVNQAKIEQVNTLISSAIGFDEARGDRISVEGMNFDTSFTEQMEAAHLAMAEFEGQRRQEEIIRQAVMGGGAILGFILLLVAILRRRKLSREMDIVPLSEGRSLKELFALEEKEDFVPEISPEKTPQGRARKVMDKNPEVAVSVLKSWMTEE